MVVEMNLIANTHDRALLVRADALQNSTAWVLDNQSRVHPRQVQVGVRLATERGDPRRAGRGHAGAAPAGPARVARRHRGPGDADTRCDERAPREPVSVPSFRLVGFMAWRQLWARRASTRSPCSA